MSSVLRRSGSLSAVERPTVGDLKMSMVGVDHVGWLKCDGRAVEIQAFRSLYEVIGDSFGDASAGYFLLPNPEGRVLGMVGQADSSSNTWIMGDVSGSETHTLIVAELPAHNHDICGGNLNNLVDPSGNGNTSYSVTGITVDVSGNHRHTDSTSNNSNTNVLPVNVSGSASVNDDLAETTTGFAGLHNHTITDPTHNHRINSNGGDQPHNNIQPTIWIGNLFVYGGRLFRDTPEGGNWFPPSGPLNNIY